jgi:hypothetical protein
MPDLDDSSDLNFGDFDLDTPFSDVISDDDLVSIL